LAASNQSNMPAKVSEEQRNNLTTIVMDISPVAWGERDMKRTASDKARLAAGKRSVGPATLEELIQAVQAFASAFLSLERNAALILIAVAGSEIATVYPRKDHLEHYFANPERQLDTKRIPQDIMTGISELVAAAAAKESEEDVSKPRTSSNAAMASGFSMALCMINRFLVQANAGVSALQADGGWNRKNDDEGVLGAIGGKKSKSSRNKTKSAWSPRVLLIQASDDIPSHYNAMMNCAFAAVKNQVVVDGCFIPEMGGTKSSAFLEQTCDLTGGVFLAPSGAAQANKALSEVLLSVFLPGSKSRAALNLPAINKVDFRARSFDTGESVDIAFVCNQCLSIFKQKPQRNCPTCDAEIRQRKRQQT
jgi:transcription initiation factor TFIIH subunit 3